MKTLFKAEIVLCFESDVCESELVSIIKIKEQELHQKSDNRINPITKEKNEGYWIHKINSIESYDSDDIQREILDIINKHFMEFNHVIKKYSAKMIIRIFAETHEEYPALMFENQFLKKICDLEGVLDIVIL